MPQTDYTLPLNADGDTISDVLTFPDMVTATVEYITAREVAVDAGGDNADIRKPDAPEEDADSSDDTKSVEPATGSNAAVSGNEIGGKDKITDKDEMIGDNLIIKGDENAPALVASQAQDSGGAETILVEKTVTQQVEFSVIWESDKMLTTDITGVFTYTARLSDEDSDKYDLADGVKLPQITVTVGEAVPMLFETATIVQIGGVLLEDGKSYVADADTIVKEKTDETGDYFIYTDNDDGTAAIGVTGNLSLTGDYSRGALVNVPLGALTVNVPSGDITIKSTNTTAVSGQLTVTVSDGDIYIGGASGSPALVGDASLTSAGGAVTVENTGGGMACGGSITVQTQGDISISSNGGGATLGSFATLATDGGSICVMNKGSNAAVNSGITASAARGTVTVSTAGTSQAIRGATDLTAGGSIFVSAANNKNSPVIAGSPVTFNAPAATVTGGERASGAAPLITGSVTVQVGAKVCLVGGGSSFTIKDTAGKDVTPIISAASADVTVTGLDLSKNTPTVKTVYTAGDGTIVWAPTLNADGKVTGGTLTLDNITMRAEITLPDMYITMILNGENQIIGERNGIENAARLTIKGGTGDSLTCAGVTPPEGVTDAALTVDGCVLTSFTMSKLTLANGGRFNGVTVTTDVDNVTGIMTVYGDCPDMLEEYHTDAGVKMVFTPNSVLTLTDAPLIMAGSADDKAEDYFLNYLKMDAGAGIVNNFFIILPIGASSAQIKPLHLTGTGEVRVATAYDGNGVATAWDTYTNSGEKLHVSIKAMDFTKSAAEGNWKADAALDTDGYTWDSATDTLTLNSLQLMAGNNSGNGVINLPVGDCKLVLEGTNTLENTAGESCAILAKGSLTISGSGTLNAASDGNCISVSASLMISGGTVNAQSTSNIAFFSGETLTVINGTVSATSKRKGIVAIKDLKISGGLVTAASADENGINVNENIVISGGSVHATGAKTAIWSQNDIILTGMSVTNPAGAAVGDSKNDSPGKAMMLSGEDVLDVTIEKAPVTSPGGGGSSGGGSDSSNTAITTVKPSISGGTATVTVPVTTVNDAITKALTEAKKNGKTQDGITVEIKADTGIATNLTVNLAKAAVDALAAAGVKETCITSGVASIALNLDTLKAIQKQVGADVTVTAVKVDNSTLSAEAKVPVGDRPVYDLSITGKNGVKVTNLGGGKVSVSIPYTLGVNEKAGNIVAYCIDSTGKVQEISNSVYDLKTRMLGFAADYFSMYAVGYKAGTATFTDIANHWAKESIEFAVARGLLAGTGDSKFSPDTAMTRGMFVTALGRLAGADISGYTSSSFSDVKAGSYYLGYIEWANKNGIVNGTEDGKFAPDQAISREQMAVIMQNYAKTIGIGLTKVHAENVFKDNAKISSYARDAVKAMQMAGVLAGKSGNRFDPQGTAARAEVSAVLKRFVERTISSGNGQGWMRNDSGKWMFYENGRPVTGTKTIDGTSCTFDANGETADLPKNLTY